MKSKTLNQLLLVTTFLFLISCGGGNETSPSNKEAANLAKSNGSMVSQELTLNLCDFAISENDANDGVVNSYNWLRSNGGKLDTLKVIITKTHLDTFRSAIAASHPQNHNCGGFVTGVKVFFGLQDKAIKLLYKGMYLCRRNATDVFDVSISDPNYNVYTPATGFTQASEHDTDLIAYYRGRIQFIESAVSTRTFVNTNDSTGDTKALMITFQEICAVLEHNNSEELLIWNLASRTKFDNTIRHTVLLGPENMTPQHLKLIAENKSDEKLFMIGFPTIYANRSHLCPPSCATLDLKVDDGTNTPCP